MSSQKHTEGRLVWNGNEIVRESAPAVGIAGIGNWENDDLAARLVACWNACHDMDDPETDIDDARNFLDRINEANKKANVVIAKLREERDEAVRLLRKLHGAGGELRDKREAGTPEERTHFRLALGEAADFLAKHDAGEVTP